MRQSDKPNFLKRPIPLWTAVVAVLIAILSSGIFSFMMALLFVKTGLVEW